MAKNSFSLVLVANPLGRAKVEHGDFCLRTSPHSTVDLNRDWSSHWRKEASAADQQPGEAPFSQPETRLVRDSLQKEKIDFFISVHSGKLGLYTPFASDTRPAEEGDVLELAREVSHLYCQCPVGSAGQMLGEGAYGTCLDWVGLNMFFTCLLLRYVMSLVYVSVTLWRSSLTSRGERGSTR